jgi:ABC transport system ATP-binding/permease protein
MALLTLQEVSIAFGSAPLLEKVNLQLEKAERVCLLGRNGEGKTTLLRLAGGVLAPDEGTITLQPGNTISALPQELPAGLQGSIHEIVAAGLGRIGALLEEYHLLSSSLKHRADPSILRHMDEVQHRLEQEQGWQLHQRVETVLSRFGLDPDLQFETLSVGLKRRTLLARAMAAEPDVLLLDEPTNHLDIGTIAWMEEFLQKYRGTILFVTHDRMFLEKLATRTVELDRGRLFNWACGYRAFVERRQNAREVEEAQRSKFTKKLAREEEWIRQGIKARRTRNEGRVRALMELRKAQQAWRTQAGNVRIKIQEAERTGKLVIEAEGISHGYGGAPFIKDFSTRIIRGDRIGIIGPNGCGKSTLLKVLLQEIEPDQGTVRPGTGLDVIYFDQLREQLEEDKTVQQNVGDGNEILTINGRPCHVIGYLKDFLFSPDRARSPVHTLSGGERNRLLLARLFTRPSNVVVLDEPTNDLDIETLELLEERLLDYSGTILLVSHDRAFLNNVVTGTLVFEGNGTITEYAGGYDDWLTQRPKPVVIKEPARPREPRKRPEQKDRPRKLTFKEVKELEELPAHIEVLEQEHKSLYSRMADPAFYRGAGEEVNRTRLRIAEIERKLAEVYERWAELESIRETNP